MKNAATRIRTEFAGVEFSGFRYSGQSLEIISVPTPALKKILCANVRVDRSYAYTDDYAHDAMTDNGRAANIGSDEIQYYLARNMKSQTIFLYPDKKEIRYSPYQSTSYKITAAQAAKL